MLKYFKDALTQTCYGCVNVEFVIRYSIDRSFYRVLFSGNWIWLQVEILVWNFVCIRRIFKIREMFSKSFEIPILSIFNSDPSKKANFIIQIYHVLHKKCKIIQIVRTLIANTVEESPHVAKFAQPENHLYLTLLNIHHYSVPSIRALILIRFILSAISIVRATHDFSRASNTQTFHSLWITNQVLFSANSIQLFKEQHLYNLGRHITTIFLIKNSSISITYTSWHNLKSHWPTR